jgi:hypothetical protein
MHPKGWKNRNSASGRFTMTVYLSTMPSLCSTFSSAWYSTKYFVLWKNVNQHIKTADDGDFKNFLWCMLPVLAGTVKQLFMC